MTLAYLQYMENNRPDITLILPSETRRYYLHGEVENYLNYVAVSICQRPVYSLKQPPALANTYELRQHEEQELWVQVLPAGQCDDSG